MTYHVLKIGSDAEIFLSNKELLPVPVCGLVGGTKEQPLPVPSLGEGYAVQEDNVMLEFNIPPAGSATEFSNSLSVMLKYLEGQMRDNHGLNLLAQSSVYFPEEQLQSEQAKKFGCDPDYDVWRRAVNTAPDPTSTMYLDEKRGVQAMRSSGFHIHVSYHVDDRTPELEEKELFIKAQDLFLGVPSIFLEPISQRRQLYGRAGCFRIKDYGHEYRVIGSGLLSRPDKFEWIFNQTMAAAEWLNTTQAKTGVPPDYQLKEYSSLIREAINRHAIPYAEKVCNAFGIAIPR